jgi:hypothetical protein
VSRKLTLKSIIRIFGLTVLLASFLTYLTTFFLAYLAPEKAIKISINCYNEANFELICALISIPFVAFVVWDYIKYV